MLIESRSNFSDIFKLSAICLSQMQRAEARCAIALAARVTDDRTLKGLSCFDFQPRFASLSGEIGALALFGHDAFKTHFFDGFEQRRSIFDNFTHAISGIFFNRSFKPLASPCQRLVDNRTSIQIKAVEEITYGRVFGPCAFNATFRLLLHAMDHVAETRLSIGIEADNFSVK